MSAALSSTAPRSSQLLGIAEGPEGVRQTLEIMRQVVKKWRVNPEIRQFAEQIVSGVPSKNKPAEIRALHAWVRDNIRYTDDVNEVETLKEPNILLQDRFGDCDDKSTLLATFLETMGIPARFVAISYEPDIFEHVYVEARLDWRGGEWISLETTEPVEMGWAPEEPLSRIMRHI